MTQSSQKNVLGDELSPCCFDPMTGYFRNGYCETDKHDHGSHTVCAVVTEEFLAFSKAQGNDLTSPRPQFDFPGLKPGDQWCLCAARWLQAYEADKAPRVRLKATHEKALEVIDFKILKAYAIDMV